MASNYCIEHINFCVADFDTAYHAILGALAKCMAVPHYAYLVMKMPSPVGVLALRANLSVAYAESWLYGPTSPLPTPARQRVSLLPKPPTSPSRWLAWSSKPRQDPLMTWRS